MTPLPSFRLAGSVGAMAVVAALSGQPSRVSGPRTPDRVPSVASSPDLVHLPVDRATFDPGHEQLTIELAVGDVPPAGTMGMYMRSLSPTQAIVPAAGTIYSVSTAVLDGQGHSLPRAMLHHVNLTDPTRRELFLSTSLHIFAASKETPPLKIPSFLLGVPLERDQRLLLTGMIANSTPKPYHDVRIRVVLGYRPAGRVLPMWRAYPWVMDAMHPLGKPPDGSKAFDLPPGVTVKSWESSPAVPGYILGIGGHVHDYAVALDFTDVTTGQAIWHGVPERDSAGRVILLPVQRFFSWHRLGVRIDPSHRYRISVTYDNPTGHVIADGGMGAVAGLFVPTGPMPWPQVDTADVVYRQDLEDTFQPSREDMPGMMMGSSSSSP
jgi:hypothetical protein